MVEWLAGGGLAGVQSLVLWNGRLTDAGARALAECADAVSLRGLDLSWNRIGPQGVKALADSPWLAELESLRLYHNDAGPVGARAAAGGQWRLEALNLCGNGIGPGGAAAIATGDATRGLRSLHLGWVGLGDEGVERLASRRWARLAELNVRDNGITDAGARAFVGDAFPCLRRLGLDDNPIGRETAELLVERIASCNLVGCEPEAV